MVVCELTPTLFTARAALSWVMTMTTTVDEGDNKEMAVPFRGPRNAGRRQRSIFTACCRQLRSAGAHCRPSSCFLLSAPDEYAPVDCVVFSATGSIGLSRNMCIFDEKILVFWTTKQN